MTTMKLSAPIRSQIRKTVALAAVALFVSGTYAVAQSSAPTKVQDASALHPPAGANVAIVEFADLECPACAHANPQLTAAAAKYKIPLVRHDQIIPNHQWSKQAAIYARWFDSKGNGLGDGYRDSVFSNQISIYNLGVLTQFTQRFAQSKGIALPFSVDPQGKLAAAVDADTELGRRTGVVHTPTVFIVTAHSKGAPYREVLNINQDLYRMIDEAIAEIKAVAPAATHVHKTARPVKK